MKKNRNFKIILAVLILVGIVVAGFVATNNALSNKNNDNKNNANKKEEKEDVGTKYTEIGKLKYKVDEAPIAIEDSGYIIKVNGLYGFIDLDQKILVNPEYDDVSRLGLETKEDICFGKKDSLETMGIDGKTCAVGIGGTSNYHFAWNSTIKKLVVTFSNSGGSGDVISYPVDEYMGEEGPIVSLEGYKLFPILTNEEISENKNVTMDKMYVIKDGKDLVDGIIYDKAIPLRPSVNEFYHVYGFKYISALNAFKKGEKWAILDQNMNKISDYEYDVVRPISDVSTYVEKEGKKGMLDRDGKLALIGTFEDLAGIIDGKTFVKVNGEWIQIQINK